MRKASTVKPVNSTPEKWEEIGFFSAGGNHNDEKLLTNKRGKFRLEMSFGKTLKVKNLARKQALRWYVCLIGKPFQKEFLRRLEATEMPSFNPSHLHLVIRFEGKEFWGKLNTIYADGNGDLWHAKANPFNPDEIAASRTGKREKLKDAPASEFQLISLDEALRWFLALDKKNKDFQGDLSIFLLLALRRIERQKAAFDLIYQ